MRRSVHLFIFVLICVAFLYGLPAQDSMGRKEHYFPQMVIGEGSTSVFVVYNPNAEVLSVELRLWRSDGSILSTNRFNVPAGGTQRVTAGEESEPLTVGWARLSAADPFEVTEFFQIALGGAELPRVGVPSSEPSQQLRLFCFEGDGVRTGVALANIGTGSTNLLIRRYDEMGSQVEVRQTQLEGRSQLAKFLDEAPFFDGLTECSGSVEIESTSPLVAMTLRSDYDLLASAPVLTPAEVLPDGSVDTGQLADGAVTNPKLAGGSVTTGKLADGSVTGAKIVDGSVTTEDLADGAVTQRKLEISGSPESGQVLGTDGSRLRWQDDSLKLPFTLVDGESLGGKPAISIHNGQGMAVTRGSSMGVFDAGISVGIYEGKTTGISSYSTEWRAIYGGSQDSIGIYGESYGSIGIRGNSQNGDAVYGRSINGNGVSGFSVSGSGVTGTGDGSAGVRGYSAHGTGVYGESETGTGVYGSSEDERGVLGISDGNDGVMGTASADNKSGVYAVNTNPAGYAGYFRGRVHVQGNITTSGAKPFKIDHPLDPEHRYLMHAAVESNEVLNFYSGNVVLDAQGTAEVELPDWFEVLNTDVRYSLTPIGAPGPGLYVSEEVTNNRFRIAGGVPGSKVSWQITAKRNDPGMQLRPFHAEVDKSPEERGTYLDPEAYGQPPEKGYDRLREGTPPVNPEMAAHPEFVAPPVQVTEPE